MNCPKCKEENEQNARFCRNYGVNLHYIVTSSHTNNALDILVLISISYWFIANLLTFTLQKTITHWNNRPVKYFQFCLDLIFGVIPILFALSIRNRGIKIVGLIIASIVSIYIIYCNIDWLIKVLK